MAYVNFKNSPSEETPLTGGATGNLNVMQENGTSHGTDIKLGYAQSFLNEHIINVSNEVDENYKVNVLFSKELYNSATITNGVGISDTNGKTYVDSNLFSTDYTDISGASDICWYGSANQNGVGIWGAFYNSSKQYVSGITTSNNTISVPDNAKYVRLSMIKIYTNSASIQKGTSIITPSINVDNEEIYNKGTKWTTDISGVFSYRKINGVVYIRFNDKQITTTSGTWLELGTLPSGIGIRPSQYIVLDGANNGVDGKYTTAITTTGLVKVRTITPGTDVINGLIFYIP